MSTQRVIDTGRIYPNRWKALTIELERLKTASISDRNKELIRQFLDHVGLTSGFLRKSKLSSQLRHICEVLIKDLDKADKSDVVRVVSHYNNHADYAKMTKKDYRRSIKQFYRWYKGEDPRMEDKDTIHATSKFYAYLESEVSTKNTNGTQLDPAELITEEDIRLVVGKGCRNVKERAFIMLLFESGCRAGEYLNILLKDIKIERNHAIITVAGKTGVRQLPIVQSLPYLVQWLESHPRKDDPESYLWLTESRFCYGKPFKHRGAFKLVDNCFHRAGLDKGKHNLHWFRHSCASRLHKKMPPMTLHKYMGWSPTSKQISNYVHIGNADVLESVLESNGVAKAKDEKKGIEPKICTFCEAVNKFDARYCCKCGNAVDNSVLVADQEKLKKEADDRLEFLMQIMANPRLKAQYENFKKNAEKSIS